MWGWLVTYIGDKALTWEFKFTEDVEIALRKHARSRNTNCKLLNCGAIAEYSKFSEPMKLSMQRMQNKYEIIDALKRK